MSAAITELEAGIACFVTLPSQTLQPFSATFKAWHTDFHVHEIGIDGRVVRLEKLWTKVEVASKLKAQQQELADAKLRYDAGFEMSKDEKEALGVSLGEGAVAALERWMKTFGGGGGGCVVSCGGASQNDPEVSEDARQEAFTATTDYLDLCLEVSREEESDKAQIKAKRTAVHGAVRKFFSEVLNSESHPDSALKVRIWNKERERRVKSLPSRKEESTCKTGGKSGNKKGGKKGRRGKGKGAVEGGEANQGGGEPGAGHGTLRLDGWPKDQPEYLLFRLYKENRDTMEALQKIAHAMNKDVKHFAIAGTKDRRGCTTQLVSMHKCYENTLLRARFSPQWDPQVCIDPVGYVNEGLALGKLCGNQFDVYLRDIDESIVTRELLERSFVKLQEKGFLNYFGLQRFGTQRVRTHEVGVKLLQHKWAEAIQLLLGVQVDNSELSSIDSVVMQLVRRLTGSEGVACGTGSAGQTAPAAEEKPAAKRQKLDEGQLLECREAEAEEEKQPPQEQTGRTGKGRSKHFAVADKELFTDHVRGRRWEAAIDLLPKNQHIEHALLTGLKNGLPPKDALQQLPRQTLSLYYHAVQSLVFNLALSARTTMATDPMIVGDLVLAGDTPTSTPADTGLPVEEEDTDDNDDNDDDDELAAHAMNAKLPAVRVVRADDAQNTSLVDRVVLPLPGCDVQYPEPLTHTYDTILAALGVSREAFGQAHLRAIKLTGHYRKMVVRPSNVEWEWFGAGRQAVPIVKDVERLVSPEKTAASVTEGHVKGQQSSGDSPDGTDTGRSGVLKFRCQLPPSAYFTMALREVTKRPVERS